jgi:cell volume regulation protein A
LLLVFLIIGMLAGEDGPGGIVFNDADREIAVSKSLMARSKSCFA